MVRKTTGISVDEILSNPLVPSRLVHIPEWGGSVTVRGLTARQRDQLEESVQFRDAKGRRDIKLVNVRARLTQMAVFDEENRIQLFKPSQVEALGNQPSQVVSRIADVVYQLSGMTAEDVEEIVGNSETTPEDDFSTNSQGTSDAPSVN